MIGLPEGANVMASPLDLRERGEHRAHRGRRGAGRDNIPWWDVEISGNEGANGDGIDTSDRVPALTTVTFALRFVF